MGELGQLRSEGLPVAPLRSKDEVSISYLLSCHKSRCAFDRTVDEIAVDVAMQDAADKRLVWNP
jgi:hypothetical protein